MADTTDHVRYEVEDPVAVITLVMAIVLGVFPIFMFDIMNPSIELLTDSMQQGYEASAPAAEALSTAMR